jgi:DNA-binding NtrC family response regulator
MAKKKMALVVDDDQFMGDLVSQILMNDGYNTVVCTNFEHALKIYSTSRIHLVVTDIFMPGMGGIEGIQHLRDGAHGSRIIAMSGGWGGMSAADTITAAQKIGADAGLQKPFTSEDLEDVLESLAVE